MSVDSPSSARFVLDALRARLEELDAANLRLTATLNDAQADLAEARADLKAERSRAEAARADMAGLTAEFDQTIDELRQDHAAVVAEQARTSTSLPLDELLTVFTALGRAATVSDVLTTLVDALAREFSRVVLLDVHDGRLEGVRQVGFDAGNGISNVAIPLSANSLLARAVKSGRLESVLTNPDGGYGMSLPFDGSPACALAMPLVVQGVVIAVIYADDSDKPEFATSPHARTKFAELLHHHTLHVLLRVWVDQRTLTELREFAVMLVNELEYAYAADVKAGTNSLECQHGLRNTLECSRRIYGQRIAWHGPAAAALLDEQLDAVIQAQGGTAFARDLACILGRVRSTPRARVVTMRR